MVDAGHLLETMHPMREPPAPEAITPALLLLAIGCIGAAAIVLGIWWTRRRSRVLQKSVEGALAAARTLPPAERLAAQAMLLRRLARGFAGEDAVLLRGAAWLSELDRIFATRFFTDGAGRIFGDGLYREPSGLDLDALDQALVGFADQLARRPARPVGAAA